MLRSLLAELRRRNVWRAAVLYAAAAWLLVQVATQVLPFLGIPDWVVRWTIVAAAIGFPFWIAFAWLYEWTPEGLKREREVEPAESITHRTGRTLDRWIIGTMALAIVLLLTNTFVAHDGAGLASAGTADAAPARSVAVLPFENLSSDREQEYFADGIAEDLLDLLTRVPALRVAARTSSFAFKGQNLGVPAIARRLHVANVLQGSVRRAGDQVRITVQLVHAPDGYQVWSQTWNRELDDVFQVQDEIASDVARQLRVELLGVDAPRTRQTDPRAYALFLQAREVGHQVTREAFLRSDSLYRQVLAIDPRYVPAWTELARNLSNQTLYDLIPGPEGLRQAREAAERALAIDASYAPAHALLGSIAAVRGDLAGAAPELERALALGPTDPDVLNQSAGLLETLGRVREAVTLQEYLVARDPLNGRNLRNLGNDYLMVGRYDDAIVRLRMALSLSPGRGGAHFLTGTAWLQKGDARAALAEMRQEPVEAWRQTGLSLAYHALGRKVESDAALAELIRRSGTDGAYSIACVYAFRGEADRAFQWLGKAVEYDDPNLSASVAEPLFAHLRSDPRWLPFLRRIGLGPEQRAAIRFSVPPPTGAGAAPSPAG